MSFEKMSFKKMSIEDKKEEFRSDWINLSGREFKNKYYPSQIPFL